MKTYRHLFGPVPSRRFGRSLGVDLTPFKTCSFDCVFCQLGRTKKKTLLRKEYVPIDDVLAEIKTWLETDGAADYITLSGSGEPTLHTGFGKVFDFLKNTTIPSVLLTNCSTMTLPEVRESASNADIVKISLSAWDTHSFEWVNRPHPELQFSKILEGMKKFGKRFNGKLWIEVFLLLGMNSMPEQVKKIAAQVNEIKPDCVHLNTVVRPPAEDFASALSKERLESLTGLFDPPAEIIAEFNAGQAKNVQVNEETILAMLKRRPCTIEQIADIFNMHINEMSKYLGSLMKTSHVRTVSDKTSVYYVTKSTQ